MPCILVVDDEELIRGLVQRVLERRGYTVVTCPTAAEALAQTQPFDLLLVDLILPEMDGRELADALRLRCPGLPVVLMSGYLPTELDMLPPPSLFLQKPMLPGAVIDAVEALLAPTMGQWGNGAMFFIASLPHCPIAPFQMRPSRRSTAAVCGAASGAQRRRPAS